MKVSLSWLREYVPIQMSVERLVEALTMVGLEVDSVHDRYGFLERVPTGRVLDVAPHPNVDRLRLCQVDVGQRRLRIVCGAPNVETGMIVPVALPGTVFPDGRILEASVIRGTASEGMLCSAKELDLGPDAAGILALEKTTPVGIGLNRALDLSDPVLEIDLTPNRPDCASVIGIAREIAAIQKCPLTYPETAIADAESAIAALTSVTIDAPGLCPRYAARLLQEVTVGPSPFWLQDRLVSVGLRPINNIVDVTNFVLMEMGQPLHAFDFDRLAGHRIVVRKARDGEVFTTLDGKQRRLGGDMLMICDGEKPVAIGGVMGGENSEIAEATSRVLIESAYFNPLSIRRTAKTLGLSTEAAYRFERGVDPHGTVAALNRAARLMADLSGGFLVDGCIDAHPRPVAAKTLGLTVKDTNRLLGTDFDGGRIASLLRSIEFSVDAGDDGRLEVTAPSFRVDISRPEDLMEEVARLAGYENIPLTYPAVSAQGRPALRIREMRNRIRNLMAGFGFAEAITYSFISANAGDRLRLAETDRARRAVRILNPLSEDLAVMRTSLVPGLLEALHRNVSHQEKDLKLFEIGKAYFAADANADRLPEEVEMLAALWTGARSESSWHGRESACDFFDLKGVAESLLKALNVAADFAAPTDDACRYTRAGVSAEISAGKTPVGLIGEVHPEVAQAYGLRQTAYIFELNLSRLLPLIPDTRQSRPIPKFPSVSRDITLIVDKSIASRTLINHVEQMNHELVEDLLLFDVFEGKPIAAGKKSVSFRIVYRSASKTLLDEEVNRLHARITDELIAAYKASLPA